MFHRFICLTAEVHYSGKNLRHGSNVRTSFKHIPEYMYIHGQLLILLRIGVQGVGRAHEANTKRCHNWLSLRFTGSVGHYKPSPLSMVDLAIPFLQKNVKSTAIFWALIAYLYHWAGPCFVTQCNITIWNLLFAYFMVGPYHSYSINSI